MNYPRPKILFVDDDENVLNGLRRSLKSREFEWDITYETDPLTALEFCKTTQVHVVITDLDMPSMNGVEFIEKMRATHQEIDYILLTGSGDFASAIEAINRAEVFRFFTKPCPTHLLIEAIELCLQDQNKKSDNHQAIEMRLARAAFELIAPVLLVVEPTGHLVYANKSGTQLLAQRDGISLDASDICRGTDSQVTKNLHERIGLLSIGRGKDPVFLSLPRPSLKRDLSVVFLPFKGDKNLDKRLVAMLITDPETNAAPEPGSLVDLFGLTPSEAKIGQAIAQGISLEEAARKSGITVSSARTYLKRIYSKTNTNGQADLVKLILSSAAALV